MAVATTTRRYEFEAVHELDVAGLRERKHGHRYRLEVSFSGVAVAAVDRLVELRILPRLQARELRGEFEPATGEILVEWIHARLRDLGPSLHAVAIQETRKNRFISQDSEARFV